jgi:hypothetical protein
LNRRERAVFLIGTSHEYQRPDNPNAARFRDYLTAAVERNGVKAIAEEMSVEGLRGRRTSTCRQVAVALCVDHRYCDPSKVERKDHGMLIHDEPEDPNDEFIAVRVSVGNPEDDEQPASAVDRCRSRCRRRSWWLHSVLDLNVWPVLFVCGRDHTDAFRRLLSDNGIVVKVLCSNWAPISLQ